MSINGVTRGDKIPLCNEDGSLVVNVATATPTGAEVGLVTWPILKGQALGNGDLTTDAWGVQKVSFPISLFHGLWTFDIPQSMWFMYENGVQVYTSTNVKSTNCAAEITADATVTNAVLESRECPRYQPNRGHLLSTALWCPNKTADGVRTWGLGTAENGVGFRLKADGLLYAVLKSASVETHVESIDMSGLPGFDVEKGNIYDIQFQWRGVGNYKFFVNNVLVHTISLLGTLTALSMENPAQPIKFSSKYTTESVSIFVGCADITSENGLVDKEHYSSMYAENVSVNGTDRPVIVAYNPLQVNGQTNTRTVTLARISFTCSKKATFKVWATRDPSTITGATLVNLNFGSYMQTDSPDTAAGAVRASSVTTTNFKKITAVPVEAAVSRSVDNPYRGRIEFPLVRGDYLVVTCTASTATADVVIEMGEQI